MAFRPREMPDRSGPGAARGASDMMTIAMALNVASRSLRLEYPRDQSAVWSGFVDGSLGLRFQCVRLLPRLLERFRWRLNEPK